jgi:geranylgeranyl diphosphate synthase type I
MLDFDTSSRMQISREELIEKTKNKTAYYTFIYPLLIGNQLNTSPENDELLTSIGDALGLAYQIQDDLIDIIGTSPDKPHLQDVANGQHTLMSQHIFENGNPAEQQQLLNAWRKPVSKNDEAALLHLFKESGAIQSAQKEAAELFGSARSSIANLSCFNLKTQLIGLTELLEHREK